MSLRDELRSRKRTGPQVEPVVTPEWPEQNGQVFVPKVTARQMDKWYEAAGDGNGRALYVAMFACDQVGNRHFNDSDAAWLGDEDFALIDRIFAAGMELNRSTPKAAAELEKNLPSGTAGDSLPIS